MEEMNIQEFFRPLVVEGGPGSGRRVNLQVRGQISGMRGNHLSIGQRSRRNNMQISNKSWKQIDKSKLPKECFFEGTNLPYREAVNGKAGPVNVGALRAALVACNEMKSIPAKLEGQIVSVLTELRDGEYAGEMYCRASFMMALGEGFMSLDQTMRNAVKEKFGTEAWMTDFSDQEVIFELPVKKPQTVATGGEIAMSSRQLFAVGYEIKRDGTVVLGDEAPVPVERAVIYEPIDTAEQLFHTVMDLMDGAVVLENLLDEKGKVGKFIDKIAKGVSGTTETPYALAVWKAKEKFGKKKVSKAMSKKKMTKEKLELEQSKAEKHSAIADRFHTLEKKYKERGHKNRAYLAHRVAAKHAAIAKEAMELLDEYGVQGMKWGQGKVGFDKERQGLERAAHKVYTRSLGRGLSPASRAAKQRISAGMFAQAKAGKAGRVPLSNLKGKELRQWRKFKGFGR